MRFWRRFQFVLPPVVLALAACGDVRAGGEARPAAVIVVDDAGREVRLARPPERVVSLVPSGTELIVALGAAGRLVGRTDFDRDPALAGLPSVGGGLTPNLESLAALRPELVIAWPDLESRSVVAHLGGMGVPAYAADTQTLADVVRTIRHVGALLGLAAAADSLITALDAELAAVRRAVAGRERPRVFYVVWNDPPITAGPGTFIHDVIEIAGGRNIFDDARGRWPQVSLEEALYRRPDVIVLPQGELGMIDVERLRTAPGWRALEAVRAGRIFIVDADLFNRPGPRVAEAARRLAALLHPDAAPAEATP